MRATLVLPLIAGLALTTMISACATPAPMPGGQPGGEPQVGSGDDCAVIAAIGKEHYRFNAADNVPPPLWLDADGSDWAPRCDWARYGLDFPTKHDPNRPPAAGERLRWVQFKQPRYDGAGAVVETAIMHGPLAGMGYECRVRSGFAGWTVQECKAGWVS